MAFEVKKCGVHLYLENYFGQVKPHCQSSCFVKASNLLEIVHEKKKKKKSSIMETEEHSRQENVIGPRGQW